MFNSVPLDTFDCEKMNVPPSVVGLLADSLRKHGLVSPFEFGTDLSIVRINGDYSSENCLEKPPGNVPVRQRFIHKRKLITRIYHQKVGNETVWPDYRPLNNC